jgi:hydroxyacylglutathione hydrolase
VIDVHVIDTPALGDRSYVATDGRVAVVVDPQRDIERVLALVARLGVRITHVLETHVHNDYLSGGLALARRTGAEYVLSRAEDVIFEHLGVDDGDELTVGAMRLAVVATPGHTAHHLAYVVSRSDSAEVLGTFTGGSLLFGTAGRTDLTGPAYTETLARSQWRSIRRLAGALPDQASVWPAHGFGSFCSGGAGSGATASTAGAERRTNPALVLEEGVFVAEFVARLGPHPSYYRYVAALNRIGAGPLELTPPALVGASELRRRLGAGEWVVDLRPRRHFAAGHVLGAVNIEGGDAVATYVGWVVPWGVSISLVGPDEATLFAAQVALGRIGIEPVARHVAGEGWPVNGVMPTAYPVRSFQDLAGVIRAGRTVAVLDVRAGDEWRDGHLPGAIHIPFHDLGDRVGDLPAEGELWVHCAAGFRAAIAASLLSRFGRRAVLVDDRWFMAWEAGLEIDGVLA